MAEDNMSSSKVLQDSEAKAATQGSTPYPPSPSSSASASPPRQSAILLDQSTPRYYQDWRPSIVAEDGPRSYFSSQRTADVNNFHQAGPRTQEPSRQRDRQDNTRRNQLQMITPSTYHLHNTEDFPGNTFPLGLGGGIQNMLPESTTALQERRLNVDHPGVRNDEVPRYHHGQIQEAQEGQLRQGSSSSHSGRSHSTSPPQTAADYLRTRRPHPIQIDTPSHSQQEPRRQADIYPLASAYDSADPPQDGTNNTSRFSRTQPIDDLAPNLELLRRTQPRIRPPLRAPLDFYGDLMASPPPSPNPLPAISREREPFDVDICGICFESFEHGDLHDAFWCPSCGKNYHDECVRLDKENKKHVCYSCRRPVDWWD